RPLVRLVARDRPDHPRGRRLARQDRGRRRRGGSCRGAPLARPQARRDRPPAAARGRRRLKPIQQRKRIRKRPMQKLIAVPPASSTVNVRTVTTPGGLAFWLVESSAVP